MERVINSLGSLSKSAQRKEPFEYSNMANQEKQLELPFETEPRDVKLTPSEK